MTKYRGMIEFTANGEPYRAHIDCDLERDRMAAGQMTRTVDGVEYAIFLDLHGGFSARRIIDPRERLEYLRGEIRAERISQGEIAELQGLAEHIEPGDVELAEWAGIPEEEFLARGDGVTS